MTQEYKEKTCDSPWSKDDVREPKRKRTDPDDVHPLNNSDGTEPHPETTRKSDPACTFDTPSGRLIEKLGMLSKPDTSRGIYTGSLKYASVDSVRMYLSFADERDTHQIQVVSSKMGSTYLTRFRRFSHDVCPLCEVSRGKPERKLNTKYRNTHTTDCSKNRKMMVLLATSVPAKSIHEMYVMEMTMFYKIVIAVYPGIPLFIPDLRVQSNSVRTIIINSINFGFAILDNLATRILNVPDHVKKLEDVDDMMFSDLMNVVLTKEFMDFYNEIVHLAKHRLSPCYIPSAEKLMILTLINRALFSYTKMTNEIYMIDYSRTIRYDSSTVPKFIELYVDRRVDSNIQTAIYGKLITTLICSPFVRFYLEKDKNLIVGHPPRQIGSDYLENGTSTNVICKSPYHVPLAFINLQGLGKKFISAKSVETGNVRVMEHNIRYDVTYINHSEGEEHHIWVPRSPDIPDEVYLFIKTNPKESFGILYDKYLEKFQISLSDFIIFT